MQARKGRPQEKAMLRFNAVKVDQTNSARRLQKDLKELEDCTIPLVGVTARPLSNSLYQWHGNLRGPEGSLFEGGVFHIELNFPQDYPVSPPAIKLFTPVPHPNVLGGTNICLDILDKSKKEIYQGWTSAYTVEAILIQLQSFLFEELPIDQLKEAKVNCKEAVKLANNYRCVHPDCNHQGPIKPYPPFNQKEKELDQFVMLKTSEELLAEELICFHTKLKLKDASLGIGISISRLPRTGEIRLITPTMDLLSMRAFIKQKVRHSLANDKFTHWLPLFFGESDIIEAKRKVFDPSTKKWENKTITINCKERSLHLLKKSLSFICSGSTRKPFKPEMILQVMPKLIITHVASLIQDTQHISILAIRRLINFIRLFKLLLNLHPEMQEDIDKKILEFIKSPEMRHKDVCGSLGDFLSMVTVSQKFKVEEILPSYLEEQMDRQVFWILKEIPELDHEDPKYKDKELVMEDARAEVCFKTGLSGFHITLFFYYLNKLITEKGGKDIDKLCQYLDNHYGCLPDKDEDIFQKKCFEIQTVKSFMKYFPMLGVAMPDEAALRDKLKQAIENSRRKKYHGDDAGINEIPKIDVQAKLYLEENVKPFEFYSEEKKAFLEAKNPKWEKACYEKFSWIKQIASNQAIDEQLKPWQYAQISDDDNINIKDLINIKNNNDKLRKYITFCNTGNVTKNIEQKTIVEDYDHSQFSWRELFLKLCFEQQLQYFPQHQDFKLFYKYIDLMGPHIQTLRLKILDKAHFKSNNYYLMVLVGRMKNLKVLKLHKDALLQLGADGFKFLQKGFKYFQDNGGQIEKIQINNILGSFSEEYLYATLKCIPDLRVLKLCDQFISIKDAQTIGRVLSDFKNIQELDMTNCNLDSVKAKEVADGLMRAKQLQIIKMGKNYNIGKGAESILYNLAFSPKISHIDFSDDLLNTVEAAEAVYKLVKISGSLETLILKNTYINNNLKEEFFIALGENKTINYLNLDQPSYTPEATLKLLGKAIGMNQKKDGNLKHLSMTTGIQTYANLKGLLDSCKISDYAQEMWYGDKKIAKDMKKEQLETKFFFGLETFDIGKSILSNFRFRFKDFEKRSEPNWPHFMQMFTSKSFDILNLTMCQLTKNDVELLAYSLNKNPYGQSHLRVLNLSRNAITKDGAKTLAIALEENNSLEVLDLSQCNLGVSGTLHIANSLHKNKSLKTLNLYRNKVDVDGARALRELLKVNSTLEFLDVGHNRLREKGIKALTDGICENPTSKIKHLGIRFNFINDDGLRYFFENCIFKNKSKINHIYLMQNYMSEHYTLELQARIEKEERKLYVDGFEKIQYLNQARQDRSIWISPIQAQHLNQPEQIWKFFQKDFECGLISDVRVRRGQKIPGKPQENYYAVIEYAHNNSVPRSLRIASKKQSIISGQRFRIYKAGTRTIVFVRPQKRK